MICLDKDTDDSTAQPNDLGYPVTYTWDIDANGTDSVFDGITTPGTHTYKVVANANGCLDSLELQQTISHQNNFLEKILLLLHAQRV